MIRGTTYEGLTNGDLDDLEEAIRNLRPDSFMDDCTDGIRYSDISMSTACKFLCFMGDCINDICWPRTVCHEESKAVPLYQNAMKNSLACVQDLLERMKLENMQSEYLRRFGHGLVLDTLNRRKIKSLIRQLQGVLNASTDSHPAKKRKLNPPSEGGQILRQKGSSDFLSFGLPNELTWKIFNSLSTADLAAASQTSRRWYTHIVTHTSFLTRPCFVDGIDALDVEKYIEACRKIGITSVTSMTLPNLFHKEAGSVLAQISNAALQVADLRINLKEGLSWESVTTDSSFSYLHSLTVCVNLRYTGDLDNLLRCAPSLQRLKLSLSLESLYLCHHTTDTVKLSGVHVKNLQKLSIYVCDDVEFEEMNEVVRFIYDSEFRHVNWLEMYNVPLNDAEDDDLLETVLGNAHPQKLTLRSLENVNFQNIVHTLVSFGITLTYLDIEGHHDACSWDSELETDFAALSKLEYVSLETQDPEKSAAVMSQILETAKGTLKTVRLFPGAVRGMDAFQYCPLLECLQIEGEISMKHPPVDIGELLRYAPNLKTLRLKCLRGCPVKIIAPEKWFKQRALNLTIDIIDYGENQAMDIIQYLQNARCCSRVRCMRSAGDLEVQEEVVKVVHVV